MVLNRYHPMVGGAERQCERLCQELAGQVAWVGVLTHRYADDLAGQSAVAGVTVHRLGRPGSPPLSFYAGLALALWRSRGQYDLIHGHTAGFTGIWLALLARLLRKPVLLKLTARGELEQQLQPAGTAAGWTGRTKAWLRRRIARFGLAAPDLHLVALTPAGAEEGRAAGLAAVHTVPNGIDADRYLSAAPLAPSAPGKVVFGYAGRLTAEKGTHTLATAFGTLLAARVPVQLSIVGSGDRQRASSVPALEALQQAHPSDVALGGTVENTVAFLHGLDFYVSASTYEGMPNAVLEALAAGLPCILSDIDAHRELARLNPDAYIAFFPADDPASCAEQVRRHAGLAPRPRSRLSPALRMDVVAQRYLALYEGIIRTAGAGGRRP